MSIFSMGSTGQMLFQDGSVSQYNFIIMINIVLVIELARRMELRPLIVKASAGQNISQANQPLAPGDYEIYAPDDRRGFDSRNRRINNKPSDAAHIPPLEKESFWVENNFSLWITNEDSGNYSEPVNAIQNGFFYQAPEEGTRIELAVRDRHQMLTFFWFIACFMGLRESVRIGIFAARADPREASNQRLHLELQRRWLWEHIFNVLVAPLITKPMYYLREQGRNLIRSYHTITAFRTLGSRVPDQSAFSVNHMYPGANWILQRGISAPLKDRFGSLPSLTLLSVSTKSAHKEKEKSSKHVKPTHKWIRANCKR
ncbi:conserved hypothetical protein [Histoplasma capsulatum H143]|uniref:Uncharacterized protein n=1 Tax=Ajellomyces capsulatus (strain H143) TaxID=544712 RepID=C6HQF3_AJECH|nr:conserved hypothetical protein [Histoplasma capsulatum H143]